MKTGPDSLRNFCQHYEAYVGPLPKRYRRPALVKPNWDAESDYYTQQMTYEEIPMVEIQMPEDRFRHLVEMRDEWERTINRGFHTNSAAIEIWRQFEKESKLRHQHPALQDLWEQYQSMLALVNNS